MENYENFFEWILDSIILTAEFNAIFYILLLVIMALLALKLFVSLIAQIKNLFK